MLTPKQNISVRANIESVLGTKPLWWLWPSVPNGNGLKFKVADGDGKWVEFRRGRQETEGYLEDDNVDHQA